MDQDVGGKFALVTGCGRGSIGEASAREFLDRGLNVIATVLPGEESEHLVQSRCHTHVLDVTDETSVAALHKVVEGLTGGRLDVLGNNAGIDSVYFPMRKRFVAGLDGTNPRMTAQDFARNAAANILAAKPSTQHWCGTWAPVVKFMSQYLPRFVMDRLAFSSNHLDELRLN